MELASRRARRLDVPLSLLVVAATVTVGFGAIFALLPDYQTALHFPAWGLGAAVGASFLAGFVAQVVLSRYADRGYGRLMLFAGVVVSVVGLVWLGIAHHLIELIGARIVLGLGEGCFVPAARRVVIERNPENVGAALGRLSSFTVGGFLLGPPIGAVIADAFGLRVPFFLLAALLACALPSVSRMHVGALDPDDVPRHVVRTLLRSRGLRAGLLLGVTLYVPIGVYDSLWARFLEDLGATRLFVAISLTILAAPIALLSPVAGRLADRVGPLRLGTMCAVCTVPFIVSYGFVPVPMVLALIGFVQSVFDAGGTTAGQAAVAESSPPALVAAGQGLYEATGLMIAALSAAVAAPLYGQWGAAALWTTLGIAVGVCGLLAYHTGAEEEREIRRRAAPR
ncbi:MAG TPA: MFS transporter [Acidimicrobiia bacterium]|nr:MFS transporter [Acidimicrobiia bacterium]